MNIAELSFISILVIMIAFYLILVRPSQQEQKRQQQTIRDLRVGDEVVTTSGFFARIEEIHTPEEGPVQLVLDLGDGLKVRDICRRDFGAAAPTTSIVLVAHEMITKNRRRVYVLDDEKIEGVIYRKSILVRVMNQ